MNEDDWRPVDGFPDYSVNPLGQVRRDYKRHQGILHTRVNQYGLAYVGMMRDGRQCIRLLARLVASTFLPQPKPLFDTPINLDGDRTNCVVDNLAWRPRWYAVRYHNQFTDDRYPNPLLVQIREIETGYTFPNSFAASCYFGLLERDVVLSILNNTVTALTYQEFEVVED